MDENKFWLSIWKLVALCLCVLIVSASGCSINKQNKISDLVQSGTDPIGAYCAINGPADRDSSMCVLRSTKD